MHEALAGVSRVVVVAPGGAQTGGVELLHQLVDTLLESGVEASIHYRSRDGRQDIPAGYREYRLQVIPDWEAIDASGTAVVLPEVYSHLLRRIRSAKPVLWWLSVDNYLRSRTFRYAVANRFVPFTYYKFGGGDPNLLHLCQSHYALDYVARRTAAPVAFLSDFINDDYVKAMSSIECGRKRNLLVYNPAKGLKRTSLVLDRLGNDYEIVALEKMRREEVVQALIAAKVYIDLGGHPGKDRIPREAAALGCCVVTNRRGSAAFAGDVPIPEKYKVDDSVPDFADKASSLIRAVFSDFEASHREFEAYRRMIASERRLFRESAKAIFAS